jgi:hypothetical protein
MGAPITAVIVPFSPETDMTPAPGMYVVSTR